MTERYRTSRHWRKVSVLPSFDTVRTTVPTTVHLSPKGRLEFKGAPSRSIACPSMRFLHTGTQSRLRCPNSRRRFGGSRPDRSTLRRPSSRMCLALGKLEEPFNVRIGRRDWPLRSEPSGKLGSTPAGQGPATRMGTVGHFRSFAISSVLIADTRSWRCNCKAAFTALSLHIRPTPECQSYGFGRPIRRCCSRRIARRVKGADGV